MPAQIRQKKPLDFGKPMFRPAEVLEYHARGGGKNKVLTSLIGQGYHAPVTPACDSSATFFENPAMVHPPTRPTSRDQSGRLEALFELLQTMIKRSNRPRGRQRVSAGRSGRPSAEAIDDGDAPLSKSKAKAFFVDRDCHPQNSRRDSRPARPRWIRS